MNASSLSRTTLSAGMWSILAHKKYLGRSINFADKNCRWKFPF